MYPYEPIEALGFPGFYEIPGFSRYAISRDGIIIKKATGCAMKMQLNTSKNSPNGSRYREVSLIRDDNNRPRRWGRHRLMCLIFKYPGIMFSKLMVNHINGIKGDDWLDNLEWVTGIENIEHAGALGLTDKCCPISIRDIDTGQIVKSQSIVKYARSVNVSKDFINYRVKAGETRIFPERKQYRAGHGDEPWYIPKDIDEDLKNNGTEKGILVRDVFTGVVTEFDQYQKLADHLKITPSVITYYINKPNQPVLLGHIQLKKVGDTTPWREITDCHIDTNNHVKRVVKIIDSMTNKETVYSSAIECARELGINPSTLNMRLKSNGNIVYGDGYRYLYYS